MELLLCNTNLAVTTVVCQLVKQPDKNFMVFTDVKNIYTFLSLIAPSNMELHFIESNYGLLSLWGLLKKREEIKTLVSKKEINNVYCYHQAFGGFYNWIISYCHKRGCKITYYRLLDNLVLPQAKGLGAFKLKMIYRLIYSTDIVVLERGNSLILPKLSTAFYQKNEINEERYLVDEEVLEKISQIVLSNLGLTINKHAILLLTGSVIDTGQVTIQEYSQKIKDLIQHVGSNHIVAKCHPRFNDETEDEKKLAHIPSYIPMEFLLGHFRVYIGYNSTILKIAADKGLTAISLVSYMVPVDEERRDNWYIYFGKSNIIYPRSVFEILNVIK